MDKALSAYDIYFLNNKKCNLFLYEELKDIKNIDTIFTSKSGKNVPCILLYPISKNMGHWVSLIRDKNVIEFFDPYGMGMDDQLMFCDHDIPFYLSNLTKNYFVYHNDYKFQKLDKNISTCGRWVILRCFLWYNFKIKLEDMIKLFSNVKNKDEIVTYITSNPI